MIQETVLDHENILDNLNEENNDLKEKCENLEKISWKK